jgi:hypothetical protein
LAGVDAGADDLQRGDLLLAAEQHGVVGQGAGARHAHDVAGAGVERDARARALKGAQLGDRLFGDDAARGCAHAVRRGDGQHAGAALHASDAHRVLEVPGGLGGEQQRQPALDRGLHRFAEVHHRARLRVALGQWRGAEPALGELARGERDDAQRELAAAAAVAARVAVAADEQPAPAVALVARHARRHWLAEGARELLRKLPGGVQALLGTGVERVAIDPLQQRVSGVGGQRGAGEVTPQRPSELGDEPNCVQR